jgi:hypothetical protein
MDDDNKKTRRESSTNETETVLMALDQLSQTIDVMTSVVGRLRTYLQDQQSDRKAEAGGTSPSDSLQPGRTVH